MPVVAILLILAVLKMFVLEIATVQGNDMAPALVDGDMVLLSQLHTPQRGDVIVFEHPLQPGRLVLRRVIGLPGDAVDLRGDKLSVNGQSAKRTPDGQMLVRGFQDDMERMVDVAIEELHGRSWRILDDPRRKPAGKRSLLGGAGGYVVFADNRDHGRDSREYGPVRRDLLLGKALLILRAGVGTSPSIDALPRDFSQVR